MASRATTFSSLATLSVEFLAKTGPTRTPTTSRVSCSWDLVFKENIENSTMTVKLTGLLMFPLSALLELRMVSTESQESLKDGGISMRILRKTKLVCSLLPLLKELLICLT